MAMEERAKRLEHLTYAGYCGDVFPKRFKEAIEDANVNKERLAIDGVCCREASCAYSNGLRIPNGRSLLYICNYLNVSADWLLGLSDEKKAIWR